MVSDAETLARRFEVERPRLRAVALRVLGSPDEADDAVQEAWVRLSRQDAGTIDNLPGWLTTVTSRICLDVLRSRRSRREEALPEHGDPEPGRASERPPSDPQTQAELADGLGAALLVVLDTLAPAERLAFVLHDLFDVPFDEIAPIVDRTPAAARQLASRARRRVRGGPELASGTETGRQRRRAVVDAFLAAARAGEFTALVALLDPDAAMRADATAAQIGASPELRGAESLARLLAGGARAARPASLDAEPGLVWVHRGAVRVAFVFGFDDPERPSRITAIDLVGDPTVLAGMAIEHWAPPPVAATRATDSPWSGPPPP